MSKLQEGDKLPEFSLLDQDGNTVTNKDLEGKPLVIYFYPKDDTPGCTAQACSFRDNFADFEDIGAKVVGLSADSPDSHKKFAEKHRLPFTLLSDKKNQLRKKFGVPGSLFGILPGRVTYVFNKDAKLVYTFNSQLKAKQHMQEALDQLKKMETV